MRLEDSVEVLWWCCVLGWSEWRDNCALSRLDFEVTSWLVGHNIQWLWCRGVGDDNRAGFMTRSRSQSTPLLQVSASATLARVIGRATRRRRNRSLGAEIFHLLLHTASHDEVFMIALCSAAKAQTCNCRDSEDGTQGSNR